MDFVFESECDANWPLRDSIDDGFSVYGLWNHHYGHSEWEDWLEFWQDDATIAVEIAW